MKCDKRCWEKRCKLGRIEKIFKWDNNTNLDGEIKRVAIGK